MHELLSTAEMARADAAAIAGGVPGIRLMEAAGRAVADAVATRFPLATRVAVLCGPGNNGGDGFVAARVLRERGFRVRLGLLGDVGALKGDAAEAAARCPVPAEPLSPEILADAGVVVDALFGAGLARPLEGVAAEMVRVVTAARLPVVAVDLPSGISGDTGQVLGCAFEAIASVTFFRRKPGHLLLPGRRQTPQGWVPPPPLLETGENAPALLKILRLKEHIRWAAERGVLADVHRFLEQLREEDWLHSASP